jgi:hypothetical protein
MMHGPVNVKLICSFECTMSLLFIQTLETFDTSLFYFEG